MTIISLAIGWISGLLLGAATVGAEPLAGLAVVAALATRRFRSRPALVWAFLAFGSAALGDLRYGAFAADVRDNVVAGFTQRSIVTLRGVVVGDPTPRTIGADFPLDVRELERSGEWTAADGTILVRLADTPSFQVGDRLEVAGVLAAPDPLLPPRESRLRQEGIVAVATNPRVTPLGSWESSPRALMGRAREHAAAALDRSLPEPEAGLARGIALGQQSTLDPDLTIAFSQTNTSHLLAVDGFKVGLVARIVDRLLAPILPFLPRALGTIAGIALYTVFVGGTPSALRAAIMGIIFAFGRVLGRPADTLNALAIAALLMTAVEPFLLWNLAFQLSFVTTLGMTALTPMFEEWIPARLGVLREVIGTTIAAEIASAPLILTNFNHVSLASLPVHAIVMPLLPLAIALSGVTAALGAVVPSAGDVVGLLAWVPLAGIVGVVGWAGALPMAALPVPRLGLEAVLAAYLALGLGIVARPNPFFGPGLPLLEWARRIGAAVPARYLVPGIGVPVVAIAALLLPLGAPVDRIQFLDVAGGDAALVSLSTGPTLFVQGTADATRVARAADSSLPLGDRSIDLALLTVGDDAALTGLTDLAGRLPLRQAIIPGGGYSEVALGRWNDTVASRKIAEISVDASAPGRGPTVALGDRGVLAIYPLGGVPKQGRAAAVEPNVAARLAIGSAGVVWASALPADQVRLAASGVPLSANVLKLVGRGSRWGLDPDFFRRVNPSVVILPAGAAGRFARPTPGTLDLLANRRVYRTDLDGTVVISLEAEGLRIETARGQ